VADLPHKTTSFFHGIFLPAALGF